MAAIDGNESIQVTCAAHRVRSSHLSEQQHGGVAVIFLAFCSGRKSLVKFVFHYFHFNGLKSVEVSQIILNKKIYLSSDVCEHHCIRLDLNRGKVLITWL